VLVIVDDINSTSSKSISSLLRNHIFGNGSDSILTSRDWDVIKNIVGKEGKMEMDFLEPLEALDLFDSHVFKCDANQKGCFLPMREDIMKACCGLPLSLEVMGAFLHDEPFREKWKDVSKRLRKAKGLKMSDDKLWNSLQISFHSLELDEKMMLLDVACFFCNINDCVMARKA
jgi:hypothetical protein